MSEDHEDILGSNIEPVKPTPAARTPKAKTAPVGMPQTVRIVIEENDSIPPTGLFVGLNGKGYLIRPGEEVNVPRGVMEILDNAVMSAPQIDPGTRRVVGYRERMRYPYRVIS
jgi:hypothetical protein